MSTSATPTTLLSLASTLSSLASDLASASTKLSTVAGALEQEAANVALANATRWGVDVQVAVRAGPEMYVTGNDGAMVKVVNGAEGK
jgi:NADH:ubiquinone oxidoreductase subunit F (NADH-binding)